MDTGIDKDEAWIRFQLLLLDNGAQIRDTVDEGGTDLDEARKEA